MMPADKFNAARDAEWRAYKTASARVQGCMALVTRGCDELVTAIDAAKAAHPSLSAIAHTRRIAAEILARITLTESLAKASNEHFPSEFTGGFACVAPPSRALLEALAQTRLQTEATAEKLRIVERDMMETAAGASVVPFKPC